MIKVELTAREVEELLGLLWDSGYTPNLGMDAALETLESAGFQNIRINAASTGFVPEDPEMFDLEMGIIRKLEHAKGGNRY